MNYPEDRVNPIFDFVTSYRRSSNLNALADAQRTVKNKIKMIQSQNFSQESVSDISWKNSIKPTRKGNCATILPSLMNYSS